MRAECYVLDIYCDQEPCKWESSAQFTGRNQREAHREARDTGWKISRDGTEDICPKCQGVEPTRTTLQGSVVSVFGLRNTEDRPTPTEHEQGEE